MTLTNATHPHFYVMHKETKRTHTTQMQSHKEGDTHTLTDMGAEAMLDLLEKKKFKDIVVAKLNAHIDLPFINESTEARVLDAVYGVVLNALNEALRDQKIQCE